MNETKKLSSKMQELIDRLHVEKRVTDFDQRTARALIDRRIALIEIETSKNGSTIAQVLSLRPTCTAWEFGRDARGYNSEWQCGKPYTDTCDYCSQPKCDAHMQIKRGHGLGGRAMCNTTKHS